MSWCGLGQRATIYLRWALGVLFLTLVAVLFGLSVYDGTIFFTLWLWFMSTVVLQARSQPFPVPLRVLVSVLILLGAGFVTLIPWILFGGRATCQARRGPSITVWGQGFEEHWLDMQLRLSCTWVMILIAIYITLGDHPPSTHIRQISRCIYFLCFGKLIQVIPSMVDSCHVPNLNAEGYRLETSPDAVVAKVSSVFGLATSYVGVIWFMQLVVQRLLALEEAFGKRLPYSRASFWLSRALTPWVVLQGFALYFSRVLVLLIAISLTIGIKVLAMLLCIAYQRPLQFLHRALKMADDDDGLAQEMRKETRFAMKLIRKSQIAIFLGTTGMAFSFISFGLESMLQDKNWSLVYVVASSLDALSIVGGLAMLSGVSVFKRSPQLTSRRSSLTSRRQDCDSSCSCEKQQNRPCEQCRWQAKVAELAGRRVTVEELLDFYLQLGGDEAMPHFDPETSTTNDVVRQMVIPSTLKEDGFGYSYAELCDDRTNAKLLTASGTPRTARRTSRSSKTGQCPRMVTHHWSNRFRDLLAAVLADALNLKRWDKLAERLMARKGEELKEQLYGQGSLHQEYWICAFCINQHASICSNAFGAKDTATGQALPCCGCRTPKVLNDQPIDCEMNKFDNMMAYLHQEFDGFLQVVAIDNDFQIFSRAWCVAELVQADASHLEQHMVIHSPDALEANKWQLNHIRVEDCQASRPEDKQTILAKIGSPEEVQKFNEHLHLILLGNGGLLACWMDGQRLLQEIGAISARAKARVERQSRVQAIPPAALGASSVAGDEEKSGEVLPTFML